jgi:von Willebrand factor type A domain.
MEQLDIIETKKADKPENEPAEVLVGSAENEHAEAVALVEKHRDFFEHYAKGKIKIEPAPADLKTFAFNLEKNTIYINSMFYKKLGLPEEKTVFATLHEIEHFMEKLQILAEDGGEKKFDKYLKKIKTSRAFSLLDNCVADIRENRAVISKTNKGMKDLETKTYQEDLFAETDFTFQPRHIQFSQALLREARVPGEQCQVAPDVRQALDEAAKVKNLMEIMTNPETPMSMRLKLQDKYLWPKVEALLEKDIEDKKNQPKPEKKDGEAGEGKPGEQGDEKGDKKEEQEGSGESKKGGSKNEKKGENKNTKGQKNSSDDKKGNEKAEKTEGDGLEKEETDPNKIFADDYVEAEKKFSEGVPLEEIEKAFKEWKEAEKGKNGAEAADEDYAKKIGVEKNDLQDYRKVVESLQKIVNPETDLSVIEELKNLFSRIISKRLKKAQAPKYPVEEGDELADPAQLVADVKSGNLQPKVWEDTEIKEKKGDRFGEVEITLVCDRSSSMDGQKALEQRKSAVLVMEVLKEFAELCEAEKINIDKPLEVKSEIYSFASSAEDKTPLKKMSAELGEAERINVLKKLYYVPGSTTDFNCLEAIDDNLDDKTKIKIKIGELKKIVIVFTDGGSDNPAKVQGVLKSLRDSGVAVIGVGITGEGKPVLSTYAPTAQVVEDVSKLPIVLGELLKEHLKDL